MPTSTLATPAKSETTGAEDVRWNLTDLYETESALKDDMRSAATAAERFADQYRGMLETMEGAQLAAALKQLEAIQDSLGRAYTYGYLDWSTDTEDTAKGALLQWIKEQYTAAAQHLIFLDVEWAQLDDSTAERLLQSPHLERHRHHLELQRKARKHVLSEPEERVLSEKSVTGWSAWNRFFDETLGATRFEIDGEILTEQEVLSRLSDHDRERRRSAALALSEGLAKLERPLTYVFNTILADKASNDRLRGYDHWLAGRNQSNEIEQASVEALIEAVTGRYDLVERFYRLKAQLLDLDGELQDYDRYAPVGGAERRFSWEEAQEAVVAAYKDFHPEIGGIVERFFEERWIDAAVVPGKRGGAYSHGAVPSVHPYILMNYTGRGRDVQTLAHELGHGVHQYLSREQGIFHADTPLTTAETASVFGEMLVFQRLLDAETDPAIRLAMLIRKIDDSMATVFRQVTMNRFEERIHTHRREAGELSPADFSDHWMKTQSAMFGDSVRLGEHYHRWWSYIPHFVHTPGYVYAYAFGELLVLSLYNRFRTEPEGFAERYRSLLAEGGSDWPHNLLAPFGIDLNDPDFWQEGLAAIEALIDEAERLAP
ncbi:M3 family oligoendopeptidase [soil metagenome]